VGRAPKAAEIRLHLAQALVESGDKVAARKELEAILQLGADVPQRAEAQALLAELEPLFDGCGPWGHATVTCVGSIMSVVAVVGLGYVVFPCRRIRQAISTIGFDLSEKIDAYRRHRSHWRAQHQTSPHRRDSR
jgi:FimV-like protein